MSLAQGIAYREPSMDVGDDNEARDIGEVLGLKEDSGNRKLGRIAAVALAGIIAALVWYIWTRDRAEVRYKTVPVTRGDLTVTVTATGTVQPVNQVEVGTEVSGT